MEHLFETVEMGGSAIYLLWWNATGHLSKDGEGVVGWGINLAWGFLVVYNEAFI